MNNQAKQDERIAKMIFGSVYPLYVTKVERKGKTKEELDEVISWLTGYDKKKIHELVDLKVNFSDFFQQANLHPNAALISGTICGVRIDEISDPLTKKVRYLDKLVDELAKGKKMERILRT